MGYLLALLPNIGDQMKVNMLENRFLKKILPFLIMIGWIFYAILFLIFKNNPNTSLLAGILSLVGQTGLDFFAAVLVARLFVIYTNKNIKKIAFLFFISFISAMLADGIYNVEINLWHLESLNTRMMLFFEIPFSAFLFFQQMAFGYIITFNNDTVTSKIKVAYMPYITASFLIFIAFMFGVSWKINYFSFVGFFQFIDTIFEAVGFTWAIICLARANTWTIRFIAVGYLLIVSSDLIIRYHVISGVISYLNIFELLWILGLLSMCIGFFIPINMGEKKAFHLLSINSIQSHLSIWTLMLWLISALLFSFAYYIFTSNVVGGLETINRNFLSMIIPFSILAIISSNYISNKISSPLLRIENKINDLMVRKKPVNLKKKEELNNPILEFIALENFVSKSFDLYNRKHEIEKEFVTIATQVAHDIRSPLAAINIAILDIASISENKRIMIKSACKRINDIANNLLYQSQDNDIRNHIASVDHTTSPELIYFILENIVAEKNYEYRGRPFKIILDGYQEASPCFSSINLTTFKRILSNIINNSVEALNPDGYVCIQLSCDKGYVDIMIQDNGCGIPPAVLPSITEDGFSYGKQTGTGCGLFHAKQHIEQMHGSLVISSDVDVGTTVRIRLLRTDFPDWFCDSILVTQNAHIVILDDDPSIHDAWNEKFSAFTNMTLSHFMTSADLMAQPSLEAELYLMDYELLAGDKNGLDVIEHLDLNRCSFLVTSCFEDSVVRKRCEIMGVKILPKPYVSSVPIILSSHAKQKPVLARYDLIFVDDSKNLTDAWELVALKAGKHILTFNNLESFEKVIQYIDLKTPIYIDSDLGCKIKGEQYAESLFHRGFKDLYLSTGHMPEYFGDLPWIRAIVGKEPPVDFI